MLLQSDKDFTTISLSVQKLKINRRLGRDIDKNVIQAAKYLSNAISFNAQSWRMVWNQEIAAKRSGQDRSKGDKRILGDGEFVTALLSEANEKFERHYKLRALGYDLEKISQVVSKIYDIEIEEIYSKGWHIKKIPYQTVSVLYSCGESSKRKESGWFWKQFHIWRRELQLTGSPQYLSNPQLNLKYPALPNS